MKPRIAITGGDPAGIGPEIAAKAAADWRVREVCEPIIYAPEPSGPFAVGEVSAVAGRAAFGAIVRAVEDAKASKVDGLATAPVNKAAFAAAGLGWKGHTDLLAHLCGVGRVAMLFHAPKLRVVLATVHVPLRDVSRLITRELVRETLKLTALELPYFGVERPRLAVAALNPHAGEGGLMGFEDDDVLTPAIREAREDGVTVTGPHPADTVFVRAVRGEFDCVLACYHDQGLIPVKLLAFGTAVNVTLGLPIVRTSVDHGTAFDIAGQGIADHGSLVAAVRLAAELAVRVKARS
ncbi:MAG TPA: 4-hydroxythreonine-4-phosphate dehydrogenase PdxA [Vicinamibacterales bacterium]|nr:4-hydroxythreonine-4-phosphate dehydrogenase PdxA [Vicinamibacterales bacterium]